MTKKDPRVMVSPGYAGAIAQEIERSDGALAVEVTAVVGDTVVDVRHLSARLRDRRTARTLLAAGASALLGAVIVCGIALWEVAEERAGLQRWMLDGHDARTFPHYV